MPEMTRIDLDSAREIKPTDILEYDFNGKGAMCVDVVNVETKTKWTYVWIQFGPDDGGGSRKLNLLTESGATVWRSVPTETERAVAKREQAEFAITSLIQSSLNAVFDARRRMESAANDSSPSYHVKWGLDIVAAEATWEIVRIVPSLVWDGSYTLTEAFVVIYDETAKDVVRGTANGTHRSSSEWSNVVESVSLSAKAELVDRQRYLADSIRP